MRRLAILAAVVLCSIPTLAGEYLINEEAAYGLRVTFSEPVTLTYFGDVLMQVSPEGEATEFVFSGAELPAWMGHGLAWTPATARIAEFAWLSESQVAALGTAKVTCWKTDTLRVELISSSSKGIDATVIRTISQEHIPFVVEYFVELPVSASSITWTDLGSWTSIEGPEARFMLSSNAESGTILLEIETDAGASYSWLDELDFLLHNKTHLTLDATHFVPEEEIVSVQWSAANGDPDDVLTFPIAEPNAPRTSLVSQWPNVLDIQCDIQKTDGTTETHHVESLVYFRDGTPFEIRGTGATVYDSIIPCATLTDLLRVMFGNLKTWGFNAINVQINWWYGHPDEQGDFDIHPIHSTRYDTIDPRGQTITSDQLETYLQIAGEEQFSVHVQLRQWSYANDPALRLEYDQSGFGTHAGFRNTEGFLYGSGRGYENMLLRYLPIFVEHDVASVFLGAENGDVEAHGSTPTREFYRDIISAYRAGGYQGALSYAAAYFHNPSGTMPPFYLENLDPARCGIPWDDMDYVSLTFYPSLTETSDATTAEMYTEALSQIDEYLRPFHEAYHKPLFIDEMCCWPYEGCAVRPTDNDWRMSHPYDPEEQRRWHTALLRALAHANEMCSIPWIKGVVMYEYSLDPWFSSQAFEDRVLKGHVNAEENEHLRLLAKVFFRDVPLQRP